jgi:hypothetical protein
MANSNEPLIEQRIRQRAYRLWQDDGSPDGHADDYWHEAAKQIEAEGVDVPVNGAMPEPTAEQSDKGNMESPVPEESPDGKDATLSSPRAKRRRS